MSEENKALLRRWFDEVWNNGRADAIDEMFDEYGIAHGLSDDPENPIRGPKNFRPFHTTFREAFPKMVIVIEDMIAEGDKVAARCSVRGKHEGDFLGRAATQSPSELPGWPSVRSPNGRFAGPWNTLDLRNLHKQVGFSRNLTAIGFASKVQDRTWRRSVPSAVADGLPISMRNQ